MPLYFATLLLAFIALPGFARATTGELPSYDMRAFCKAFLQLPESEKPKGTVSTIEECLKIEKDNFDYLTTVTIFPSLLTACAGSRAKLNGHGSYSRLLICLGEESYSLPDGENQQSYLPRYDIEAMCAQRVRLSRKQGKPLRIEKCITLEEAAATAISRRRIAFYPLVDCERISRYAISPEYTDGSYIALVGCIREVGPPFKAAFPDYDWGKYCKREGSGNRVSRCRLREVDFWSEALDLVYTRPVSLEMLKVCDARVRKTTSIGSYELFVSCLRKEVDKAGESSFLGR